MRNEAKSKRNTTGYANVKECETTTTNQTEGLAMWIVFDDSNYKPYGPFINQHDAEEWLAKQGIYIDQYSENEVSVMKMKPITETLPSV